MKKLLNAFGLGLLVTPLFLITAYLSTISRNVNFCNSH